jgi:hypothetical protein
MTSIKYPRPVNSSVYRDKKPNNSMISISLSLPQINSSTTPVQEQGSLAYDPNTKLLYYSNGIAWTEVSPAITSVLSINANGGTHETGNITLDSGTGVSIVDSPAGTFTFTNAGVTSVNANSGTHETGGITLAAGSGLSIVDSPAGTFTFTNAGLITGVTSINANSGTLETGNITLDSGTGISIVDSPAGTFTFTNTGVLSISGTANQITVTGTSSATLSIPTPFIPPGNEYLPGYLNVGSSSAPVNTSTGMITGQGLSIGNNQVSFSGYPINIDQTITSSGQDPAGVYSIVDLNPSGAVSSAYTGYNFYIQTDASNSQNFTSPIRGLAGGAFHQGTGTAIMVNGLVGQAGIQGASVVGALSETRAVVGSLITANYTNAATQTIPLHHSFFANAPSINAASGGITVTDHIDFDTVAIATTNLTVTTGVRFRLVPLGTGTNRYGIWFDNSGSGSENGIRWGTTIGTDIANWYYNGSNQVRNDFDISSRHSISNSTASSSNVALGTGSNNGGTAASFTINGTDECHTISITTSSVTPAANAIIYTYTYTNTFPTGSVVCFSAANTFTSANSGVRFIFISVNTSAKYEMMIPAAENLAASTTYMWNVIIRGY